MGDGMRNRTKSISKSRIRYCISRELSSDFRPIRQGEECERLGR